MHNGLRILDEAEKFRKIYWYVYNILYLHNIILYFVRQIGELTELI